MSEERVSITENDQHREKLKLLKATWGHIAQDRWKAVDKYAQGVVLDVGCANGVYVKQVREQNQVAFGLDLFDYDTWQSLEGTVAQGDASQLPFRDHAVNCIISFETIEHVPHAEAALREYHRVCKDTLILSVPNAVTPESLRKAGFTYHHWIDRSHVNFFDTAAICELVQQCGFEVLETRLINPTLPAYPLFRSFRIPPQIASFLARVLRKLSPEKLYMSILVVARKK